MNKLEKQIIKAYRRFWNGQFEILNGQLTDDEAQKAIRGVAAKREDFIKFAKQDIENYRLTNKNKNIKLQIKCEYDEVSSSYLIYLNFI